MHRAGCGAERRRRDCNSAKVRGSRAAGVSQEILTSWACALVPVGSAQQPRAEPLPPPPSPFLPLPPPAQARAGGPRVSEVRLGLNTLAEGPVISLLPTQVTWLGNSGS